VICEGSQCPEPNHLLILQVEVRQKRNIYKYRTHRVRGARWLWEGCTKENLEVAADKPVNVLLFEATLRVTKYSHNELDVLPATPKNFRGCGDPHSGLI